MTGGFDRRKSLQELEEYDCGELIYNSYLVMTIHRLRRKALAEFTVEDLRIMIGQGIGLSLLVPLAVECLEKDPLAAGDYYPGDLLHVMLQAGDAFWAQHPDSFQRFRKAVGQIKALLPTLDETNRRNV